MINNYGIPEKSWRPPSVTLETRYKFKNSKKVHWTKKYFANKTLSFSLGTFTIELYWDHAPDTCRNFAELSRRGYYNGVKFHRSIRNFMIQSGDPTGTGELMKIANRSINFKTSNWSLIALKMLGRGGVSIYGENFNDEIHSELRHTGAGIVSMANSGANTNGR